MESQNESEFQRYGTSRRLIVFAHGYRRHWAALGHVRSIATEAYPDADQFTPRLPLTLTRLGDASTIAATLLQQIDELVSAQHARTGGFYEEIILVGHSAGAVLMRAVWCLANGIGDDLAITTPKPWAECISRLVLLAAVNRGFSTTTAMSPLLRLQFALGTLIETITGPRWTMLSFRRGSPFLTTVRLQTLKLNRLVPTPTVVQVLGTVDDFVSPNDNIDLLSGSDFHYLTAPKSGHGTVLDADEVTEEGRVRRKVIRTALAAGPSELARAAESAADLQTLYQDSADDFDDMAASKDLHKERVNQVVFVIHGIRDYGFWTKKLAAAIKRKAQAGGLECRSVTSTYGFFPMGPFLLPSARRRRVEWLLDQYVHARALYPHAEISYVGHSNGTYLLAAALECCRAITFKRVVLAGSVVRRDYRWSEIVRRGQVREVLNYCATRDWVVAIFPNFFQAFRTFGLGSSGHNGFQERGSNLPSEVAQIEYVEGAHDAAIREEHWSEIAGFVLHGGRDSGLLRADRHSIVTEILGRVPWVVMLVIAVGLVALPLQLILAPLGARIFGSHLIYNLPPHLLWISALAFAAYLFVVRKVLTQL